MSEYGACPGCGAYWGNPDKSLDFPNRQKVDNHWKCYNPNCEIGYYDPDGDFVELKLSPEEEKEMRERISQEVKDMLFGKIWVCTSGDSPIQSFTPMTKEEAVAKGFGDQVLTP